MTINLSVGISSNDQRLYYDQQTFLKLVNDTHEKTRLSVCDFSLAYTFAK